MSMIKNFEFKAYLFDAWEKLDEKFLTNYEKNKMEWYDYLDLSVTKKNLSDFNKNTVFIRGFIPESLNNIDIVGDIDWLHIDMNSAHATISSLSYFFNYINSGGVILFDDYGWKYRHETKDEIDLFFKDKSGILLPLPTGQAIYLKI